jgi:hypothetical protein
MAPATRLTALAPVTIEVQHRQQTAGLHRVVAGVGSVAQERDLDDVGFGGFRGEQVLGEGEGSSTGRE